MTHEEFISAKEAIAKEFSDLTRREKEIDQQYIDSLPFKKGDKVLLTLEANWLRKSKETKVCFIGDIKVKYGEPEYDFKAVKKDGTPSRNSVSIWSYDKIGHFKG